MFKTRPNSARALLAFSVTYFPIRNRTTVNNNNPQAGERGGGGKEFCSRSDRVDDEGEKEELLEKYLDIPT